VTRFCSLLPPLLWFWTFLDIRTRDCLKIPLQNSLENSSKEHFPSSRTIGSSYVRISSIAFCRSVTIFSYSRNSISVLTGISLILLTGCVSNWPVGSPSVASSSYAAFFSIIALNFFTHFTQMACTISIWSAIDWFSSVKFAFFGAFFQGKSKDMVRYPGFIDIWLASYYIYRSSVSWDRVDPTADNLQMRPWLSSGALEENLRSVNCGLTCGLLRFLKVSVV